MDKEKLSRLIEFQKFNELMKSMPSLSFFKRKARGHNCSYEELARRWVEQDGLCSLCSDSLDFNSQKTHLDHIVPKSQSGLDEIQNLHFVCAKCNYAKRDLSLYDFIVLCSKVENTFHKTGIVPENIIKKIIERRWRKENKGQCKLPEYIKRIV